MRICCINANCVFFVYCFWGINKIMFVHLPKIELMKIEPIIRLFCFGVLFSIGIGAKCEDIPVSSPIYYDDPLSTPKVPKFAVPAGTIHYINGELSWTCSEEIESMTIVDVDGNVVLCASIEGETSVKVNGLSGCYTIILYAKNLCLKTTIDII